MSAHNTEIAITAEPQLLLPAPSTPTLSPSQPNRPFSVETNQELATLLKLKNAKMLTWLGLDKQKHYSLLSIKKKNGTYRHLHNPDSLMRIVQYRILKNILEKIEIPDYIYAFEKNKSIPQMAQLHVEKQVILSVDIKDFFHSIKQDRLNAAFLGWGFAEKPARTLSELCTFKAFMPQGALTSPKLANLITALTFGPILKSYCDANNLTLSVYADDVTVSSNNPALNVGEVLAVIREAITSTGFRVNHQKTKVMKANRRQYVCGVVVNKKTNLLKRERQRLRAIVHNIGVHGLETEAQKSGLEPGLFASHIAGKLNWMQQLNGPLGAKYSGKLKLALADQKLKETFVTLASTSQQLQQAVANNEELSTPTEAATSQEVPW